MSGQQMFQIVSAGKTLRGRPAAEVVQEAVKTFSIPLAQARRLMVKGWVIKDQLSSKQVIGYQSRMQKIGLRVEVFPAGKFDNRALLAKMQFAQARSARAQNRTVQDATNDGVRETVSRSDAEQKTADRQQTADLAKVHEGGRGAQSTEIAECATSELQATAVQERAVADSQLAPKKTKQAAPASGNSRARAQLQALFSGSPDLRQSPAESSRLVVGAILAAVIPGMFLTFTLLCLYNVGRTLLQLGMSLIAGEFTLFGLLGSMLSIALTAFIAALLIYPYFAARRFAPDTPSTREVSRTDAQGFYLLLDVLAEKTGFPRVTRLSVDAGADVLAEPHLSDIRAEQLPVKLGLGAVYSLSGRELLALVARSLGIYRGRLRGVTAWLVLDTVKRLQLMQSALESERTAVSPNGVDYPRVLAPVHFLLANCGRFIAPLVDRLLGLHRSLTRSVARFLERLGDAWAAQVVGSEGMTSLVEKWHQLVHAELLVAETNREAALVAQHLRNYPEAVRWTLAHLDDETRSNIELAMAQTSDPWDPTQAADSERVVWAEDLRLAPLVREEFSVQKLFADLRTLSVEVSDLSAGEGSRAVDNQQLLSASKESEKALQTLMEYFNQVPPRRFLPPEPGADTKLGAMDLQETIDWLRGKLIEVREMGQREATLLARETEIQLGGALLKAQVKISPQDYHLSGGTPAAAVESARDNRARRGELHQHYQQIYSAFSLRLRRAIEAMPVGEQERCQRKLEQLRGFSNLAARLERLESLANVLGLAIDRLTFAGQEREVVQKFYARAVQELEMLAEDIGKSPALRELGLSASRVGSAIAPAKKLPQDRQGIIDALQAMELRCKSAIGAVGEHYRIQLADLLEPCLSLEKHKKVRPLRLVGFLSE